MTTPAPTRTVKERVDLIQASRYIKRRMEEHLQEQRDEEAQAAKMLSKDLIDLALADLSPKDVGDLLLQVYASQHYPAVLR